MPDLNELESIAAANEKVAETAGRAAEAEAGLDVKSDEFKETLGKFNQLVPGLGDALIAAFSPDSAPLLLLQNGIDQLIKQADDYRQKSEAAAAAGAALWEAQRETAANAAADVNNYLAALAKIKAARDDLQAAENLEMVRLQALAEAHQKILDYAEKRALPAAQGDPAKEARIRDIYEGMKSDAALGDEDAELAQVRQDLEQARFNQGFAQRYADQAAAAKIAGDTADAPKAREVQDWLTAHKDDVANALLAVQETGDPTYWEPRITNQDDTLPDGGKALQEIARAGLKWARAAEADLEQAKASWEAHSREAQAYADAAAARATVEQGAIAALSQQTQAVNDLTAKLNEAVAIYAIHNATARATGQRPGPDAQSLKPAVPPARPPRTSASATAARDIVQLQAALDRLNTPGGELTGGQMRFVEEALSVIEGHIVRVDKIREELGRIFARQNATNEAYDRLLQCLQSQQQNAPSAGGMSQ